MYQIHFKSHLSYWPLASCGHFCKLRALCICRYCLPCAHEQGICTEFLLSNVVLLLYFLLIRQQHERAIFEEQKSLWAVPWIKMAWAWLRVQCTLPPAYVWTSNVIVTTDRMCSLFCDLYSFIPAVPNTLNHLVPNPSKFPHVCKEQWAIVNTVNIFYLLSGILYCRTLRSHVSWAKVTVIRCKVIVSPSLIFLVMFVLLF